MMLFGKRKSNQDGSTVVEFGLLSVPLFTLILGLVDLGYQAYLEMMAQSISHRVAREATTGSLMPADVEILANDLLEPVLLNGAMVDIQTSSYFDFLGVGQPEKITNDANANDLIDDGDCFEDINGNAAFDTDIGINGTGSARDVVTYTIRIDTPRLIPLAGLLGFSNRMIVDATSANRNQPFGAQAAVVTQQYCRVGGINVPT